ncbi:MAG: HipA N-terminal domain-containing protein [Saprospiraceae bacterium]
MNRSAKVYFHEVFAGVISETDMGYSFQYDKVYLDDTKAKPISKTLPLQSKTYETRVLFPFFDGLIPEGWLLEVAEKNWKLSSKDRFGLLLMCCEDCIGAVSVINLIEK